MPNLAIFTSFSIGNITPHIFTALTLSLLGTIDSLLTSVVADNMTKTKHKPNKELIGQGIGNSIAAVFGGIPGAGATIRTVININSGGKTKLSGMIAGIMLLIILIGLGPIASKIPAGVLAGILITVGFGVMDYKGLKVILRLPKDIKLGPLKLSSEVLIMLVVLLLSTFWNSTVRKAIRVPILFLCIVCGFGRMFVRRIQDSICIERKGNCFGVVGNDKIVFGIPNRRYVFILSKLANNILFHFNLALFAFCSLHLGPPRVVTAVVAVVGCFSTVHRSVLFYFASMSVGSTAAMSIGAAHTEHVVVHVDCLDFWHDLN